MGTVPTRSRILAVVISCAIAASCTTTPGATSSSTSDPSTPESTTTTTRPIEPGAPMVPPEPPDQDALAASWLSAPEGFEPTDDRGLFEQDAITAIGLWLPDGLVAGRSDAVYRSEDRYIVVVSIVPTMSMRGDPGLVPVLASLDEQGSEVTEGVFETSTTAGLAVSLWSTGDGFLAVTSIENGVASEYLAARERTRQPLPVWRTGDCVYLDPEEGLPWAPIALDRVVPCDGAHNGEVLFSDPTATDAEAFDEDAVTYQRNHTCDREYETLLGPQKDRTPSLVTYMPDEDEFTRGDRYLACLVRIPTNEGLELFVGRLADRDDLVWSPEPGTCYGATLAPEGLECGTVHSYEYLGTAVTDLDAWPRSTEAFAQACTTLVNALPAGPVRIDVFPTGLYPYAFERGDRTVRCMAFATNADGMVEVVGSFTDTWRVVREDGIPAGHGALTHDMSSIPTPKVKPAASSGTG